MDGRHILMLSPALWPLHDSGLGRAVAALASELASAGNAISVVTLAAGSGDDSPLAELLTPLQIPDVQRTASARCFEGRSRDGRYSTWAIACDDWQRLGPVALRLAERKRPVDVVHAFDGAFAALAALPHRSSVLSLTELPKQTNDVWLAAARVTDALVLPSVAFASNLPPRWAELLAPFRRPIGIVHGRARTAAPASRADVATMLGLRKRAPIAVTTGNIELSAIGSIKALKDSPLSLVVIDPPAGPARRVFEQLASEAPRVVSVLESNDERAELVRSNAAAHVYAAPYSPSAEHPIASTDGGAISVAHASGAFIDSIVHWEPRHGSGNGLLFSNGGFAGVLRDAARAVCAARKPRGPQPSWVPAAAAYQSVYRIASRRQKLEL